MIHVRDTFQHGVDLLRRWQIVPVALLVFYLAATLGRSASQSTLLSLLAVISGLLLLRRPALGPYLLIVAALVVPLEIGTGTEVKLNLAALLVPVLLLIWGVDMIRRRNLRLARSRTLLPMALFLVAGLLSLLIGNVLWDLVVPRSSSFIIVQLAQWSIFAFSFGAYLLAGGLANDEPRLRRLTMVFLGLAGSLALILALPGGIDLLLPVITNAMLRAPFWVVLSALAGGQLLFNQDLSPRWQLFLAAVLAASVIFTFVWQRESASYWIGVAAVGGILVWLRWPRLRWPLLALLAALTAIGVLFPSIYNFAGGDAEWQLSGGSRLALSERVIELTMRNPITGLGPAAYRPYGFTQYLTYGQAFYVVPNISSHNNYVDVFSHTGLVGLAIFLWGMAEIALLGRRLCRRFRTGFAAGYANAMLAALAGSMVIMLLADWILPFVYNIGFPGFQSSVLVWLFLGGLVTLEHAPPPEPLPAPSPVSPE